MFNCLCINDLFTLQRYKNFWTFLLFSLCFKALSSIYLQVGNFSFFILDTFYLINVNFTRKCSNFEASLTKDKNRGWKKHTYTII